MKKTLKVFTLILFLVLPLVFIYSNKENIESYYRRLVFFSFCEEPVKYRIGSIAPEFNITQDELKISTQKAAQIWNKEWEEALLLYDPEGQLSINLVYDERQSLVSEINSTKKELEKDGVSIDSQIANYEVQLEELEQQVGELNSEIEYWNNQGGAPKEEYERLINEQRTVQNEITEVNRKAQELNQITEQYNNNVENLNNTVGEFNSLLSIKPEEGLYIPVSNRIEIYIYNDSSTFTHTLAHEFGHALGIEHLEDTEAIMHDTVSETIALSNSDKIALAEVCKERNKIDLIKTDIMQMIQLVTSEQTY